MTEFLTTIEFVDPSESPMARVGAEKMTETEAIEIMTKLSKAPWVISAIKAIKWAKEENFTPSSLIVMALPGISIRLTFNKAA